jgi:hypothetical protein
MWLCSHECQKWATVAGENVPHLASEIRKSSALANLPAYFYQYSCIILCIQPVLILRGKNIISSILVTSTQDKRSALEVYFKADAQIPASLLLSSWGRRSLITLPHSSLVAGCLIPLAIHYAGGLPGPPQCMVTCQLCPQTATSTRGRLQFHATTACKACKRALSVTTPTEDPHLLHIQMDTQCTFPLTCRGDGQLFISSPGRRAADSVAKQSVYCLRIDLQTSRPSWPP